MPMPEDTKSRIEDLIRSHLHMVTIAKIEIEEDRDHDGDPAIFVQVVFEGKAEDLKTRPLLSLIRVLRDELEKLGQSGFPYTSFISQDDFTGAAA